MKRIILLMAAGLIGSSAFAQAPAHRTCAAFEHLQQQMAADPGMAARRQSIEQFTQSYVSGDASKGTTATYTIPVVVHVLYNTAAQNISDAQIQSQITTLNQDYQLLNADAANVPAAFASLKADCSISFCLAQRDPNGAATTGIIRKSTAKTSFSADNDNAKYTSTGGDNAWNRDQYLNLWIVPAITSGGQGGILGYAQFPGGAAATDGVVIGYNYFGTTGAVSAPFNKGRTATHEVGHWFNLNHIWGDDGSACTGSDNVGDTPNQGSENYGCPTFPHVSCSNGANGDMFMNYMDYTDDACMYMFSQGQKSRMLAALNGARASLTTSQGCSVPGGGTTCAAPASASASSITQTGATVSWGAATGATSYTLQYKTSAASTYTTVSGITSTSYNLSGLTAGTNYNFQVATACSGSTSAYTASTFTTSAATGGGCTDSYEPNNTLSTSAPAIAANTSITSRIGTQGDKDYFKFTTTSAAPKVKVTLSGLLLDYDLKLYNSSGTLLGTSQNGGTTSETLIYNSSSAAATYYIYVYGYNGAYSATQCYNLIAQTSASSFRESGAGANMAKGEGITLFPNPAHTEVYFDYYANTAGAATVSIIDQAGRTIQQLNITLDEGTNRPKIDVTKLPAGFYFLRMMTPDGACTAKLIVQ